MELFVTFESTQGVLFSDLKGLLDIEDAFAVVKNDCELPRFARLSFIFIVMDPAVAPPFPQKVTYRKSRNSLEFRVQIDFPKWLDSRKKSLSAMDAAISYAQLNMARKVSPEDQKKVLKILELIRGKLADA